MSCLGGHHVAYVEEPDRATLACACGATPAVLRSVATGGHPRVLWAVTREPLHVGRPRKQASQ